MCIRDRLEKLHLYGNRLTELPSEIVDLKKSMRLGVCGNPLSSDEIHVPQMIEKKGMTSSVITGGCGDFQ